MKRYTTYRQYVDTESDNVVMIRFSGGRFSSWNTHQLLLPARTLKVSSHGKKWHVDCKKIKAVRNQDFTKGGS